MRLDVLTITNNEEEVLQGCLDSYVLIRDLLGTVSIVDNDSTDDTLDIIDSYKDKLPITLQRSAMHDHFGELRNKALDACKSEWVFFVDSDESWTSDMLPFLSSIDNAADIDMFEFFRYSTIFDRNYMITEGNGYTGRLWKNRPETNFPQQIHEVPTGGIVKKYHVPSTQVLMFDHTSCKSYEALWNKGFRYQWGHRLNLPGIGDENEYIWRVQESLRKKNYAEFPPSVQAKIFAGPPEKYKTLAEYESAYQFSFFELNQTVVRQP